MTLTIGQWIFFGIIIICVIVIAIALFYNEYPGIGFTVLLIGLAIAVGFMLYTNWWNTSTASGARNYKDYESNLNNGLDRTLKIYAEDGRMIYSYEGKIDIEDNENYILFEDENGKRHIIYYGIQDTVIIEEK